MIKTITTDEFDAIFDAGEEDITPYLGMSSARPASRPSKCVNIDMPVWMVTELDLEAERLGITRPSVTKTWLADRLDNK